MFAEGIVMTIPPFLATGVHNKFFVIHDCGFVSYIDFTSVYSEAVDVLELH